MVLLPKERAKRWRSRHPERQKASAKKYRESHKEKLAKQYKAWIVNHPEKKKEYDKRYYSKHKGAFKMYADVHRIRIRGNKQIRVLRDKRTIWKMLGGAKCVRCGCIDERILEINHKEGHGNAERRSLGGTGYFFAAIIRGKRKIDDLEVLCKVCNIVHYLEYKYGIFNYEVIWDEVFLPTKDRWHYEM